jgi:hypothetical protein
MENGRGAIEIPISNKLLLFYNFTRLFCTACCVCADYKWPILTFSDIEASFGAAASRTAAFRMAAYGAAAYRAAAYRAATFRAASSRAYLAAEN